MAAAHEGDVESCGLLLVRRMGAWGAWPVGVCLFIYASAHMHGQSLMIFSVLGMGGNDAVSHANEVFLIKACAQTSLRETGAANVVATCASYSARSAMCLPCALCHILPFFICCSFWKSGRGPIKLH